MRYAEFDFYMDTYCGSKIKDKKRFEELAVNATATLDTLTFGRIDKEAPGEEVKLALCAIVDVLQAYAIGEGGIVSASVGKKSIAYATRGVRSIERDIRAAAMPFLSNTGLLYRGFYPGEGGYD